MRSRFEPSRCRWVMACAVLWLWPPPPAAWAGEYDAAVEKITFGTTTPADVLRILGQPVEYRPFNSEHGKLSPDNLPDNYVMLYPHGLEVAVSRGQVDELTFREPSYAFRGAVQVGSTLEEVLKVVGQPLTTMLGQSGFCRSNVLYKDYGGQKGSCIYRRDDLGVFFRLRDDRVTEMCLSRPRGGEDHDYRWIDLSGVEISERITTADDLEFNSATVWPPKEKLPHVFDPQQLLEDGMNPGLGVRAIHQRGITGRGVSVGMIDQPLCKDHPEFDGKIAAYYDTGCGGSVTSTHGPGMASLLVGGNCGTAPGARLYYAAAPSWKADAAYFARALDWILEQSARLPDSEKIRVVSVSAAPSGPGSPFTKNGEMWDAACKRAAAANILVLDCTRHQGLISRAFIDAADPENVSKCQPGVPGDIQSPGPERVCAPSCPRTKAEQTDDDQQHTNSYTYVRQGGLSSSIPYTAGVLALGWQLRPELSARQMRDFLFHTAHTSANGSKIINPPAFIRFVESVDVNATDTQVRTDSVAPVLGAEEAYNAQVAQLDLKSATPADVRRVFGEPLEYRWMHVTFLPDNLPDEYAMIYAGGAEVVILRGRVAEINFEQPNYVHRGSIRVGSSLEEVIQALGEPAVTRVGQGGSYHTNVLHKDFEGEVGRCCYHRADLGVKIWLRDYKVVMIQLLPLENPAENGRGDARASSARPSDDAAAKGHEAKRPRGGFECDYRWQDLRQVDFSDQKALPAIIVFDERTLWPPDDMMPANADPAKLLQEAKNPGLGIRALHQQGITGKGVSVAIIDQPLRLDHPEFEGKIAAYINLCDEKSGQTSMHGPAVASLLVGTQCGTAPGARLYYAAAPSWTADSAHYARALDWIVEQNAQLPAAEKIRVVSVSAAPSGRGSPFTKNTEMWDAACARAEAAGILVLDCSTGRGLINPCWYDPSDPENVAKCTTGFPGREFSPRDGVCTPSSGRTTAEQDDDPPLNSYAYWGRGGLSWSIPYAAGVLALGWQVCPDLPPGEMCQVLLASAHKTPEGARVVDPQAFVRLVERVGRCRSRCGRPETAP